MIVFRAGARFRCASSQLAPIDQTDGMGHAIPYGLGLVRSVSLIAAAAALAAWQY